MTSELVRIDTNHLTLNKMEKEKGKRQKGIHTKTIEARG
jgi:hypothetical protein